MFPLDYPLAICLLLTPASHGENPRTAHVTGFSHAVVEVAIQWEIVDQRYTSVWFSYGDENGDAQQLRARVLDASSWMPMYDRTRLPSLDSIRDNRQVGYHFRSFLIDHVALFPNDDTAAQSLKEARELDSLWDLAQDARNDVYDIYYRRGKLNEFRQAIGDAAYFNGTYPPFVPTWRFREYR